MERKKCEILLLVRKEVIRKILSRVESESIEICGILFGERRKGKEFIVKECSFIKNLNNSPLSFTMDPKEMYFEIMKHVKKSMDIVGLFHSHMSSTKPSSKDLKYMRLWGIPWVIISKHDKAIAAYIIKDGDLCEVEIIEIP